MVKALTRAQRWKRLLDERRYAPISDMAQAERIERGYLGSLLRLTLLVPDIVEATLDGRQPSDMTAPRLLAPFPAGWAEQRAVHWARARPGPAALANRSLPESGSGRVAHGCPLQAHERTERRDL